MMTMKLNSRTIIVAYLMLVSLCEVSAECCSSNSLICCSRTTEILVIAVLIALCVVFFIQCIIIVCLAHRLNKVQKRLDIMYTTSRGSSYSLYSTYPGQSAVHERGLEETEEPNLRIPRARRVSGTRVLPSHVSGKTSPVAIFDNPNGNDKEIWGLY